MTFSSTRVATNFGLSSKYNKHLFIYSKFSSFNYSFSLDDQQLATAALLIYSGFAALYYAKVNPQVSDDYDYFLRRRRRYADWDGPPGDRPFYGLQPETFQRIIDAIAEDLR